jgi:hypothetical protein
VAGVERKPVNIEWVVPPADQFSDALVEELQEAIDALIRQRTSDGLGIIPVTVTRSG